MEKQEIINHLIALNNKPGGKQAVRLFLSSLGSVPFAGGLIAGIGGIWGEKEQQGFNKKITEWASQTTLDLDKVMQALERQLKEPTKASLSLLFGEVFSVELPQKYPEEGALDLVVVISSETLSEFKPYEQKGWINLRSTGGVATMGAGNKLGNSIEERKRPWGMGNGEWGMALFSPSTPRISHRT